jgi:hypothetical protein
MIIHVQYADSEDKLSLKKVTNEVQCSNIFPYGSMLSHVPKVMSLNPAHGEVYLIHYVIKFVSDLWQVSGFLQVLQFLLIKDDVLTHMQ